MLDLEMKQKLKQLGDLDQQLVDSASPDTQFGKSSLSVFKDIISPLVPLLGDIDTVTGGQLVTSVIRILTDAEQAGAVDYVPAMPVDDDELDVLSSEVQALLETREFKRWFKQQLASKPSAETPSLQSSDALPHDPSKLDDMLTIQIMKRKK